MKSSLPLAGLLIACTLLLAACGQAADTPPSAAEIAQSASLRPADARLAAVYERSCLNCHGRPESAAPLSGLARAWEKRLAKGMPVLLASAKNGLGAMPAMGLCADCSDADLNDLIAFMALEKKDEK